MAQNTPPDTSRVDRLAPSADEQAAIDAAVRSVSERTPRLEINLKQHKDGSVDVFSGHHNDHEGWKTRLEHVFGGRGDKFAVNQLNHLISLCQDADKQINTVALNAMLSMIEAANPLNELQAALATQMAMMHVLTAQAIKRAARVDQIPQYDSAAGMAVKLARTFAMQAEALVKMQRGGEQVVKIIHVHAGAQAIVGNVTASGGQAADVRSLPAGRGENFARGGGGSHETRNQPHAKGQLPAPSAQPMPEMRSKDPERVVVPVARRRR